MAMKGMVFLFSLSQDCLYRFALYSYFCLILVWYEKGKYVGPVCGSSSTQLTQVGVCGMCVSSHLYKKIYFF